MSVHSFNQIHIIPRSIIIIFYNIVFLCTFLAPEAPRCSVFFSHSEHQWFILSFSVDAIGGPSIWTVADRDLPSDMASDATVHQGLKVAHLNISSLVANLDELSLFLQHHPVDILVLTETKLDALIISK